MTTIYAFILSILVLTPFSARAQDLEPPFGVNNAFVSSRQIPASGSPTSGSRGSPTTYNGPIEKIETDGRFRYVFDNALTDKMNEYVTENHSKAWFVVNVDSLYPFTDGRQIASGQARDTMFPPGPPPSTPTPRFSISSCAG